MKYRSFILHAFTAILFLALGALTYQIYGTVTKYRQAFALGQLVMYKTSEVLGTSATQSNLTIDFSQIKGTISPEIFGGAHNPDLEHQDAWDKVASVGFTSLRKDLYLDKVFPQETTLEKYKSNENNIQDPRNWKQSEIKPIQEIFSRAKSKGMKTKAIMAYSPAWLNATNSPYAVPRDWEVYEDIVAKLYRLHRPNIDMIEIWNEPNYDHFMKTAGTSYSKSQAYEQIFLHAARAIRAVDTQINDGKVIPIGGPVTSNPTEYAFLEKILANPQTKDLLGFVSYHNYEHLPEPTVKPWRSLLAQYNKTDLPIYMSEWAYSPEIKKPTPYALEAPSIPYTASKLINFVQMDLAGSDYFALQRIDPYSAWGNIGYLGIYRWDDTKQTASLVPASRTWQLMSSSVGLGKGNGTQVDATFESQALPVLAGFTATNEPFIVVSNTTKNTITSEITLSGLPRARYVVHAYTANQENDGSVDVMTSVNFDTPISIIVPAEAVIGIRLERSDWIKQQLREILRRLSSADNAIET